MKPKKDAVASPTTGALDRLAAFFKDRSAAHGIVGASLRVVGPEGPLRHVSFGLKDRATGAKTDEATIYHWASITKTMTGIAILQLYYFVLASWGIGLPGSFFGLAIAHVFIEIGRAHV